MPISYRDAGVDIDAADQLIGRIGPLARATRTPHVVSDVGGFAGLCRVPPGMDEPLLVSGTDGVGTKLKVAFATGRHGTVGIDLVAMCVNDILTVGATPLFFLDYFACGKLDVEVAEAVVSGVAEGCKQAACALLGGETAELPGMYPDGEYDLAGFAVGVVEKAKVLDRANVAPGDALIGVASSGLHSNGYSLARRVLEAHFGYDDTVPELGQTLGEALITPTRIYAKAQAALLKLDAGLHGLAHITGGGLTDNVPRALPEGTRADVDLSTWTRPALFEVIAQRGPVEEEEMRRTFNLGIGLVAIVADAQADAALADLAEAGEQAFRIGTVQAAEGAPTVRYV